MTAAGLRFPQWVKNNRRRSPPSVTPGYDLDIQLLRVYDGERRYWFIHPNQVVLMRAIDKRIAIFTREGETIYAHKSLTRLMQEMPGEWLRIHRAVVVRPNHVVKVRNRRVYLDNGESYTISRRQFMGLFHKSISTSNYEPPINAQSASWDGY